MIEVSWIIMQIPQLQDPISVYFSILENSVMYHYIVTTMKLSWAYKYYIHQSLVGHQIQVNIIFWFRMDHYGWATC